MSVQQPKKKKPYNLGTQTDRFASNTEKRQNEVTYAWFIVYPVSTVTNPKFVFVFLEDVKRAQPVSLVILPLAFISVPALVEEDTFAVPLVVLPAPFIPLSDFVIDGASLAIHLRLQ